MNIGRLNRGEDYSIASPVGKRDMFRATTNERDLGMEIRKSLKPHDQVYKSASKAYRVFNVSREPELWKRMNTAYIKPHL